MPVRQIPLIGPEGLHQDNDAPAVEADYRYYINGYFEDAQGVENSRKVAYVKRPGLIYHATVTDGHSIQGLMSSVDRTTQVGYSNNGSNANTTWHFTSAGVATSKGTAPAASGNWTYTGPVVFTALDGISYGSDNYYAVTDFTKGAVVAADGTWTEITDADFTGLSKCTNFVGMSGYLFIGTTNNRIYNSDLNDAETWTSTSFLSANDVPGRLLWLARIRNFLIVFKDKSIEFFEDVGAPTPGSPLEARKSINSRIGLLHRNTVQEVSDGIIFVGTTEAGMARVYKISNLDLSIKPISNRYIEQNLSMVKVATTTNDYSVDANASATFMGQSQAFYLDGKEFYTVNIPSVNISADNFTQVYDNTLGIWTAWATAFATSGDTDTYGFEASQAQEVANNGITFPVFVVNHFVDGSTGGMLMGISGISPSWYDQDQPDAEQHSYPFAWTSDQFDFGSRKRKFMDSLEVHYTGDSTATPNRSASTTLQLTYRDYDYNQTSGYTVSRTLYYDPGGGVRAIARRLGSFRKRSFSLLLNAIAAMRIWAIEIQYNQGETDQES